MEGSIKIALIAALTATIIGAALGPVFIPFLHRLKFGQQVREDGPQAHLKKQGTPTMGGIMFLLAMTAVSLVFAPVYPKILPILLITLGFGLVGFLDDFLKVVKKQSEGLKVWQKLVLQLVMSAIFCIYLMNSDIGTGILIPILGCTLDLGWLYVPFGMFVLIGCDNGVNFADGLDGLCSTITVVVAIFFAAVSIKMETGIEVVCAAVAGSLMAFLLYNVYPAKVFMGDTGSLALGGFVAAAALMTRTPLYLIIVGFVYVAEVLSVIIQVLYFKKTGGKRFFRMAPIHHHFELGGWSETRVVAVFSIVTACLCMLGYLAL